MEMTTGYMSSHAWSTRDRYETYLDAWIEPRWGDEQIAGVRQSSKREKIPDILEVSEMQAIVGQLQLRERVLLFLDMANRSTARRTGATEVGRCRWVLGSFRQFPLSYLESMASPTGFEPVLPP
jgi:hypothetical protein